MRILIGIDDTDNLNTRGTGFRARGLGDELVNNNFGEIGGISRHQLYVSPQIPYTSHNSSLCIELRTEKCDIEKLVEYCSNFLKVHSAEGSDPGLCICMADKVSKEIMEFGKDAKEKVLTKNMAYDLANKYGIHLSEHGGTGGGIIGSLAGVGLRAWGSDGRFVWLKGIREMEGIYTGEKILNMSGVEKIITKEGAALDYKDFINVGEWFRPVLIDSKPTLIVERSKTLNAKWKIVDREYIKAKY